MADVYTEEGISSTAGSTPAPQVNLTTMEGMQWNANHILDLALDPTKNGVPRELFAKAKGILLLNVLKVGFIFSGNVGTGILLAKRPDGSWSPPCAMGLAGIGWGFIVGASLKDVMVFLFDEATVKACLAKSEVKLGTEVELTLGNMGRTGEMDVNLSRKGFGSSVSVAFTQGFFAGVALEGAVVSPRQNANHRYYENLATPEEIILKEGTVTLPEDSIMPAIYSKLERLSMGLTSALTEEEKSLKEIARMEAERAALLVQHDDIVHVDGLKEAEREAHGRKTMLFRESQGSSDKALREKEKAGHGHRTMLFPPDGPDPGAVVGLPAATTQLKEAERLSHGHRAMLSPMET